jgi:hypothetical protein
VLDPAGALYAAIGAGDLRAYVQGQDDRGRGGAGELTGIACTAVSGGLRHDRLSV